MKGKDLRLKHYYTAGGIYRMQLLRIDPTGRAHEVRYEDYSDSDGWVERDYTGLVSSRTINREWTEDDSQRALNYAQNAPIQAIRRQVAQEEKQHMEQDIADISILLALLGIESTPSYRTVTFDYENALKLKAIAEGIIREKFEMP